MNPQELTNIGLNIFGALEVNHLPQEILDHFQKENIFYENDDTLCLIGHGGRDLWSHLPHPLNEHVHPIDRFAQEAIVQLDPKARILFPNDQYLIPLQKIGRALNIGRPSLLGQDISEKYGLWFAYRGVFLTKKKPEIISIDPFESPCTACVAKPCLSACPAQAIDGVSGMKLQPCISHRLLDNSSCHSLCHSRLACPYQKQHQYSVEQINYHMTRMNHFMKLREMNVK